MTTRRPAVSSIAPTRPFADALAAGLLERVKDAPERLTEMLVLLPSRRAVRALQEAFLRQSGGRALLLPAMRAIGDVDEEELAFALAVAGDEFSLPPDIPPLRRRLLLAALIERSSPGRYGGDLMPAQSARLAAGLIALIDELQTEGLSLDDLGRLTPVRDDLATHWRDVLDFLSILQTPWQTVLEAEGVMEPAERRRLLMQALAERWRAEPPETPVIAAGSTGSIPTTAALLALIANLPQGEVVLPGLDRHLDEESWRAISPAHPQYGMRRLLQRLELERESVAVWPEGGAATPAATGSRQALLAEALRPAETTERWRDLPAFEPAALDGLTLLTCGDADEEARAIALAMREAAEVPERTAALVTPDRGLARRVAAELQRWNIEIDDSAGAPLAQTPPGVFLRLLAEMVDEDFHPVPLLAALKQPLAQVQAPAGRARSILRRIETAVLRGLRPGDGLDGIAALLHQVQPDDRDAAQLLRRLSEAAAPFAEALRAGALLQPVVEAHIAFAEALSRDESGEATLWRGEAGEAAARFAGDLLAAAQDLPTAAAAGYPALFATLMEGISVRPRFGRHPRLFIWGPLEARLQHADLLILGGLNERVWPADPGIDPWLNRPMRQQLGLPVPERRIGLAAHDFAQAASAPRVLLTRSERVDGGPTVPSRWLLRLLQTVRIAGLEPALDRGTALRHWARGLDRPVGPERPVSPPEPRPATALRPRRLSATQIETLIKDPYAIYARKILALEPLAPLDQAPGAADRGIALHNALEGYLNGAGDPELPPRERLLALGREAFGALLQRPGVRAFWWPRFVRAADWFLAQQARRPDRRTALIEQRGEWHFDLADGAFTLIAVADRIDRCEDGRLEIIDYKTGAPPTGRQVYAGLAPQLPLEALIARTGGFPGIDAGAEIAALAYWRLGGGAEAGREIRLDKDLEDLLEETEAGLRELLTRFAQKGMPYYARPRPAVAPIYDDYDHLSRIQEWSAGGPGDRG